MKRMFFSAQDSSLLMFVIYIYEALHPLHNVKDMLHMCLHMTFTRLQTNVSLKKVG